MKKRRNNKKKKEKSVVSPFQKRLWEVQKEMDDATTYVNSEMEMYLAKILKRDGDVPTFETKDGTLNMSADNIIALLDYEYRSNVYYSNGLNGFYSIGSNNFLFYDETRHISSLVAITLATTCLSNKLITNPMQLMLLLKYFPSIINKDNINLDILSDPYKIVLIRRFGTTGYEIVNDDNFQDYLLYDFDLNMKRGSFNDDYTAFFWGNRYRFINILDIKKPSEFNVRNLINDLPSITKKIEEIPYEDVPKTVSWWDTREDYIKVCKYFLENKNITNLTETRKKKLEKIIDFIETTEASINLTKELFEMNK